MSCPSCIEGHVLPGKPKGSILPEFSNAYLSPRPSTSKAEGAPSKRAVIILTDVFGLQIPNPKIIADNLAEKLNCDVWVPDYFNGMPLQSLSL